MERRRDMVFRIRTNGTIRNALRVVAAALVAAVISWPGRDDRLQWFSDFRLEMFEGHPRGQIVGIVPQGLFEGAPRRFEISLH